MRSLYWKEKHLPEISGRCLVLWNYDDGGGLLGLVFG